MRVLLVEDEVLLADMVADALRAQALVVDVATDGSKALELLDLTDYDVIVLDRDLPVMHGDDVCRRLVAQHLPARILMLTASAAIQERVEGLSLGADDYLPKPFAFAELLARVLALGRRTGRTVPPALQAAGVTLDSTRRHVTRAGRPLALSRQEFAVLEALMRADGAVLSLEDLLDQAWHNNIGSDSNTVRVTVSRLRAKLGSPPVIETVPGAGYRFIRQAP
ncbi:response regulator transcription factor (plasmid) [Streptoverticillium reticulum]|uniref:response regulator transcription factor n=1 Tax=Streptoverticillium reticulum TaxID=1433415 RepID=UPI0039BF2CA8